MRAALPMLLSSAIWAGNAFSQEAKMPSAATTPITKSADLTLPPTNSTWQIGPQLGTDPEWLPKLTAPDEQSKWYGGFEIALLKPKIFSTLTTPSTFGGTDYGNPPIAQSVGQLGWTGAPKIDVGYRLGDGMGEILLTYRLVASSGNETAPGFDGAGPGAIRSRLNVNTIDLDYVATEFLSEGRETSWWFFRDMEMGFGLRTATLYFDTKGTGQQILYQDINSMFSGVGPRSFIQWNHKISETGLAVYARMDASGVFGDIKQRFSQVGTQYGPPLSINYDTGNHNTGVGIGSVEAGLSWTPAGFGNRLRFTAAYTFEEWWNVDTDDSKARLSLQGLLLRAELKY